MKSVSQKSWDPLVVDSADTADYTEKQMKRIDIYTIDVGGGHIAPAQAIKEQFELLGYTDLDVRVVNIALTLNARFLRTIYKSYWNFALHYPPLINAFYRGADNPFLMQIVDRILGISLLPRFLQYLEREKPDLVLSTYFTFTRYLELFKRVGQLDAITVLLNPEPFDAHYIWFSHAFDWNLVFSRKSLEEIVEKGISRKKIRLFQFPIKPSFARTNESRESLRETLGITVQPFTFLFVFGAEGRGPVRNYLSVLMEKGLEAQVVIICGNNASLKVEMETLARGPMGRLHIVVRGYVKDLARYIAAADVVVGKSGPNQVFETLIQERPIIISSFLANEEETSTWVLANKLGWLCRTPEQFARLSGKLIANPRLLETYRENIKAMNLRSGTPEICVFLYDLLQRKAGH